MAKNEMTDIARQAQREYMREYRLKNKERLNEYQREYNKQWLKDNAGKKKQYNARYWQKKALQAQDSIESKVFKLHEDGKSLRHIAGTLDVSHMKVKRILDELKH